MSQSFYRPNFPVDILVLRRKPGSKVPPALLVLFSATQCKAFAGIAPKELASGLSHAFALTRETAWKLASDFSSPQQPPTESLSVIRSTFFREHSLIDSALHAFFTEKISSQIINKIKKQSSTLSVGYCFAFVVDYPAGNNIPTIKLPSVNHTHSQRGMFHPSQPATITAIEGISLIGLSDPSRYLISGKI